MLASTVQFSTYGRHPTPPAACPTHDARNGSTRAKARPAPTNAGARPRRQPQAVTPETLRTQQRARRHHPTGRVPRPHPPQRGAGPVLAGRHRCQRQLIDVPPLSTCRPTLGDRPGPGPLAWPVLLRKEVIQPHLPVRLPCYDLVPIASPTFDGSPSCELGHRLRVLPTFVT